MKEALKQQRESIRTPWRLVEYSLVEWWSNCAAPLSGRTQSLPNASASMNLSPAQLILIPEQGVSVPFLVIRRLIEKSRSLLISSEKLPELFSSQLGSQLREKLVLNGTLQFALQSQTQRFFGWRLSKLSANVGETCMYSFFKLSFVRQCGEFRWKILTLWKV